jgi:hypothetical protein
MRGWGIGIAVLGALAGAAPASAIPATDFTWSGLTNSANWSTAGNWTTVAPTGTIGTLTFPDLNGMCSSPDTCYTSADDLGALSINQLVIDDSDGYFISLGNGSPMLSIGAGGVQANATADGTGGAAGLTPPVILTAPQTWTFGGTVNPTNHFPGELDLGYGVSASDSNSDTLTLTATPGFATTNGSPVVGLNGENSTVDSEVGQVTVENGVNLQLALGVKLNAVDSQPIDVTSTGLLSVIDASSETGPIDVTGGSLVLGVGESPDGSIAANGTVTLDPQSAVKFYIDDNGSTPSTDYTQLSATGDISLGGSALSLQQGTMGGSTCVALSVGDTATLVSDPTGTISGTFSNAPDGGIISMSGCSDQANPVRIAYTTHAVTATVLSRATTTTLSAPSSAAATKQVMLTASVTGAGAPTGTVAFSDGAGVISGCDSAALTQPTATTATATCTTSFSAAGAHKITASYSGDTNYDSSTSGMRMVLVSAPVIPPPPGSGTPTVNGAHVTTSTTKSGTVVVVPVSCASGGASCTVKAVMTATEKVRRGKHHKTKKKTIVAGTASVTIQAGKSVKVSVKLNRTARKLLKAHHKLRVKLTVTHRVNGKTKTLLTKFITLKD